MDRKRNYRGSKISQKLWQRRPDLDPTFSKHAGSGAAAAAASADASSTDIVLQQPPPCAGDGSSPSAAARQCTSSHMSSGDTAAEQWAHAADVPAPSAVAVAVPPPEGADPDGASSASSALESALSADVPMPPPLPQRHRCAGPNCFFRAHIQFEEYGAWCCKRCYASNCWKGGRKNKHKARHGPRCCKEEWDPQHDLKPMPFEDFPPRPDPWEQLLPPGQEIEEWLHPDLEAERRLRRNRVRSLRLWGGN